MTTNCKAREIVNRFWDNAYKYFTVIGGLPPSPAECKEQALNAILQALEEASKEAVPVWPSEQDITSWCMGYEHPGNGQVAFDTVRWLRSRVKPMERLSDEELSKLAEINHDVFKPYTSYKLGYRAAEARLLNNTGKEKHEEKKT